MNLLGAILRGLTVPLVATMAVAVLFGESVVPFAVPAGVTLGAGLALDRFDRGDLGIREAFLMVSTAWLAIAVVGALPFVLAGQGTLAHPVNALFESMSGVTTTGATVIGSFDAHGRAIHLWRSVLQWLGGLGILVLAVAVLAQVSVAGAQLMETESQTQDLNKLTPRISETARLLGRIYLGLTGLMVAVLMGLALAGLAPSMTLYDAVAHAFTAVSTAGFSPRAASIGAFSPAVQWATVPFMFVGATNFVLLYHLLRGDPSRLWASDEFRFYLAVVLLLTGLVATFLVADGEYDGAEAVARHALFQVVSIVTTTGYATVDFDLWSPAAKHMLFFGMFVGGMAGSTTCSIKTVRWLVVVRTFRRSLFTEVHPEAIRPVRIDDRVVDEGTIGDIHAYVLLGIIIFGLLTVFIVADAARAGVEISEFAAMGAAASTFLNIGPAFGFAGPYGSYAGFPTSTKVAMILLMWIGRLEIVPVLVLLTRAFWRS